MKTRDARRKHPEVSQDRLREVLAYDPLTGVVTWIKQINARGLLGSIAGYVENTGHRRIRVDGVVHSASRLAWLFMTGEWPEDEVDHENTDPSDNRWINLRPATRVLNGANRKRHSNNKSGYKGVCWDRGMKKYKAYIRRTRLGYFDDPASAHAAYVEAARKLFGEYANPG
jgi:hypothetical protein